MPDLLNSVDEAAEKLGVSKTTIFALIRDGELASLKVANLRKISDSQLDEFIAAKTTPRRTSARRDTDVQDVQETRAEHS